MRLKMKKDFRRTFVREEPSSLTKGGFSERFEGVMYDYVREVHTAEGIKKGYSGIKNYSYQGTIAIYIF